VAKVTPPLSAPVATTKKRHGNERVFKAWNGADDVTQ
jgi:hypothetical protein